MNQIDDNELLKQYIEDLDIIDHHCHNLLDEPKCFKYPFVSFFTEGDLNTEKFIQQSKSTLIYHRSIKEICQLYGCKNPDEIEKFRETEGLEQLTYRCFKEAKLETIILDYSFKIYHDNLSIPMKDNKWHSKFSKVYKILRLETVLEDSLVEAKSRDMTFQMWLDYARTLVDPTQFQMDSDGIPTIGYKSIVAYRSGLSIKEYSTEQVATEFDRVLREDLPKSSSIHYRVTSEILIHFFIHFTMEISSRLDKPLPLQIHTGYGDPDLSLEKCNPLLLKPFIIKFPKVPIVLLHCSYPFCREAGFLCWVYSNVYIDIGLAIPFLSVEGMKNSFSALIELCPIDKIFYSSDAHHIPETYYLSSKWARYVVHHVLAKSIKSNEITLEEAKKFAEKIFRNNCLDIYNI
ncbi:amidohydrolase 2 family protein [Tieghemostelium lacteum]|uniref:Amidohydrolase 2 family protein n=1 Tax=Tieghemostelium lacteum TaxID=361077 RepID=A0A151Z2G4_TIELA|nr:amidohydrolase 2 family protein [Tieghemostelium lacteum]|eukprot:KYQ88156.1 amidohydrolase 2 family protein [Tieghemostelium lacteum]